MPSRLTRRRLAFTITSQNAQPNLKSSKKAHIGRLGECGDYGEKAEGAAVAVEIRAFIQLIRVRQLA